MEAFVSGVIWKTELQVKSMGCDSFPQMKRCEIVTMYLTFGNRNKSHCEQAVSSGWGSEQHGETRSLDFFQVLVSPQSGVFCKEGTE